jgi:hypothetical protein
MIRITLRPDRQNHIDQTQGTQPLMGCGSNRISLVSQMVSHFFPHRTVPACRGKEITDQQ